MQPSPRVSRVIVVVLDGVRADAIPLFDLETWQALASAGSATWRAQTVHPPVTAAAMTSLLSGVRPADHGLVTDRFRLPRPGVANRSLPALLRDAGIPTHVALASLPVGYAPLARRLARRAGVATVSSVGRTAAEILDAAAPLLLAPVPALHVLHWPDADRAGHRHGWTSRPYADAVHRMDRALATLVGLTGALTDPATVLVALADHGGGGACFRDHGSTHPHDRTIPLALVGGGVVHGELAPCTSILDVPATVAWAMGAAVPPRYAGRVLVEAFPPGVVAHPRPGRYDAVAVR